MADVWLAEDRELGRRVAIKILHERYANDEQFVERFRREATHAAGLSHQNIVSIYDRGSVNGSYFIVMEYVEGRTLKELLVARGTCPVPVAISYARQILAALRFAHRNGIIHRDIKPHNVIVDHEGRVKVADFGIARAGTTAQMTEAGSIIGTAQYLSPEQARGAPVDESSDLYSTGVVLYELVTGKVPFTGETAVEIAMKHLSHVPEPPSSIRPEIPHDLDLVDPARAREGSGRPLPLGHRDGPRSRARGARRRRRQGDGGRRDGRPLRRERCNRTDPGGPAAGRDRRRPRALRRLRRHPGAARSLRLALADRVGDRARPRGRRLLRLPEDPGPARTAKTRPRRSSTPGSTWRTRRRWSRRTASSRTSCSRRTPTSPPDRSSIRTRSRGRPSARAHR